MNSGVIVHHFGGLLREFGVSYLIRLGQIGVSFWDELRISLNLA